MIELKNISKTYNNGRALHILKGINLSISPGEFVAITGPSGSGKSTLLHIIGLLDKPTSGDYIFQGNVTSKLNDNELAQLRNNSIGFVFQQFFLLSRMNALKNISLPLVYSNNMQPLNKAAQRLKEVGLADRMLHNPNTLSGGEQQRVAIARALINDPPLILADEPTGNLDSKRKKEIVGILLELHQKGATVVMITHELDVAKYAKRIVTIQDGIITHDTGASDIRRTKENLQDNSPAPVQRKSFFQRFAIIDNFSQAFDAIFSNITRSLLSMLGILIGVAALVTLSALGEGAKIQVKKEFERLGSNLLVITPGTMLNKGVATSSSTEINLNNIKFLESMPQVSKVVPGLISDAQTIYKNKNSHAVIEGTTPAFPSIFTITPAQGRFFNEAEVRDREKLVVLGALVKNKLFGNENAIGKEIRINQTTFSVIGTLPPKGTSGMRDYDNLALIPITTAMHRFMGRDNLDSINIEIREGHSLVKAQKLIEAVLHKELHISPDNTEAFYVRNMEDILKGMEKTLKTVSLLLLSVAGIAILIGGIGIMNVMLISVTERTKEIGLRKAIGATKSHILWQFLTEAAVITLFGGSLGVLTGLGGSVLINHYDPTMETFVTPETILMALGFSAIIGITFGIWPAYRATQMNPIQALRYE